MHARSSYVRAEPNVTPMIDVMLVLLIIFMAVGPMLEAGFRASPPVAAFSSAHPDQDGDAVIGLDARGHIYLNKAPTDSATLRQKLTTRFQAHPDDRVVYLRADQSLAFDQVQTIMELASSSGARVVALVSQPPKPAQHH